MKYSLSLKCLKDIPFQKYDKEFTFIVDGKRYQTPRIVADLLSPKIRKLHFIDSSITEFYLDTNSPQSTEQTVGEEKDYFSDFLQLVSTEENIIDINHQKYYSTYFYKLGNINEYLRIHPEYTSQLSIDNAIDKLLLIENFTINFSEVINHPLFNIKEVISFISSHFYEIPKDGLKRLSIESLSEILNSSELKISDEDQLLEFLIDLYKKDHSASVLFSVILFCNVGEISIEKFIKTVEFDDIDARIWNSICKRILPNTNINDSYENRYARKKMKIEFKSENRNEFKGIMSYLKEKTGGNIHDNGTIKITSNSFQENWGPNRLLELSGNCFQCKNSPNAYVCFDFKERQIQLSHYSIKSFTNGENNRHLRNWSIEVSNDGNNWIEIDHHSNDSTLNGANKIATFKVSKEQAGFYRFIRLHQTGNSWYLYPSSNRYDVQIRSIEFFGKFTENS